MSFAMSRTLKTALLLDAAFSAAGAVLFATGSFFLPAITGLPAALLLWAGLALVPWTAMVALTGRGGHATRAGVYTVIGINLAWVAASFWVAFGPAFAPTVLGQVFVVAQALAVLGFAEFQMLGLKRSRAGA